MRLRLEDLIDVEGPVASFDFRLRVFGDYLIDCPIPLHFASTQADEVLLRCQYEIERGRLTAVERREFCQDGTSRSTVLISGRP